MPEEAECPLELEHIWGFFRELDARRTNSGMGFNPLSHEAITAWSDGMQIGVTTFERSCIIAIDDAYRNHCNAKEKKHG